MKGSEKVLEILNEALANELTAINQYFLHAEMAENWGYERLAKLQKKSAIDEMKHAEELIERILFLEGQPNMSRLLKINIGQTIKAQFEFDLQDELYAIELYNKGAELCVAEKDNGSRDLFASLLHDEEEHADFLEAQLDLIEQVGEQNYLAQQIREEE